MKPLFLGSHVELDFLNSMLAPKGSPIETIGDGGSFLDWPNEAGLVRGTRRGGFADASA